jgi:lipopolysaccharide export system permease protein
LTHVSVPIVFTRSEVFLRLRRGAPTDCADMMGSIDRYIFRITFAAFLMVLISLTMIVWLTQALKDFDLMTSQGQTILVFLGITSLLIPILMLVIAPIAFVVAVSYALNKLSSDSEFIVMNAAGMSPWRTFRPFVMVAAVVALFVGFVAAYLSPKLQRELRDSMTKVKADLLTTIVQPGRFTTVESGLTFHIRERRANGQLLGIFIDDQRATTERASFLADSGEIVKNENGTFLVLEHGSVQRLEAGKRDPTLVLFDRYAFDMSRFSSASQSQMTRLAPRERYLWDLAFPDPKDPVYKEQPGQFRAEFHERIVAPIYPLVFAVIAFAVLGTPATTRQSRAFALGAAVAGVSVVRMIGFACNVWAVRTEVAIVVLYGSLVLTFGGGIFMILRGIKIEPGIEIALLSRLGSLIHRFPRGRRLGESGRV